jgi:hypothetical protein
MATDAYDSCFSNSQSIDAARARIEAEIDGLNDRLRAVTSAAEELRDLAKALILNARLTPAATFDLAERLKELDKVDLIDELTQFIECASLGAEAVGSPRARDALQAVLSHVIYGLKLLSDALHPDAVKAQAA